MAFAGWNLGRSLATEEAVAPVERQRARGSPGDPAASDALAPGRGARGGARRSGTRRLGPGLGRAPAQRQAREHDRDADEHDRHGHAEHPARDPTRARGPAPGLRGADHRRRRRRGRPGDRLGDLLGRRLDHALRGGEGRAARLAERPVRRVGDPAGRAPDERAVGDPVAVLVVQLRLGRRGTHGCRERVAVRRAPGRGAGRARRGVGGVPGAGRAPTVAGPRVRRPGRPAGLPSHSRNAPHDPQNWSPGMLAKPHRLQIVRVSSVIGRPSLGSGARVEGR